MCSLVNRVVLLEAASLIEPEVLQHCSDTIRGASI